MESRESGRPLGRPATEVTFSGGSDDRLYLGGDYGVEITDWRPTGEWVFDNGLEVSVSSTSAQDMRPTEIPDGCQKKIENFHDHTTPARVKITCDEHIGDWEYRP